VQFKISTTCHGASTSYIKKSIFRGWVKLDLYLSPAIDHAFHRGFSNGQPLRQGRMMGDE
jgi:hypothetical protein